MSTTPSTTINALKKLGKKTITNEPPKETPAVETPADMPPPFEEAEGKTPPAINPAPKPTAPKMQSAIIQKPAPKTQYNLTAGMNHNKPKEVEAPAKEENPPVQETSAQAELTDEQLFELAKKRGFNVAPADTETPEQKEARLKRETGEFFNYAVTEGGLKPEIFGQVETLKNTSDEQLVYEDIRAKALKDIPNMPEKDIQKLFKSQFLREDFNFKAPEADADPDEIKSYNNAKAEWEKDKAIGDRLLKQRAEKLRNRAVEPITQARSKFEQKMTVQQIDYKVDRQIDIFAQQFGKEFIYKSEEGNIPIEIPDDYKKDLITKIRSAAKYLQRANPQGTVDIADMVESQVVKDFRKQIDGVIRSNSYHKGLADGKIGFKNPLKEASAGAPLPSKDEKAAQTNKKAFKTLKTLAR